MAKTKNLSLIQTSAGRGTRARPLSLDSPTSMIPKGLIRIMGIPVAEIQMEELKRQGVVNIHVITQYLENRERLNNRFGDGVRFGLKIHYSDPSDDSSNNGSGDAILTYIEKKKLGGTSIWLPNDNLFEIGELEKAVETHNESKSVVSIFTTSMLPRETIGNYGLINADLDHNVTLLNNGASYDVYYGSPAYCTYDDCTEGDLVATSSGDITSCGDHTSLFSTEFVDLDIGGLTKSGIQSFYNSVIDYWGHTSLGTLETYFFFSIIEHNKRKLKNTKVTMDLSKADYAIRIDPDNVDNTGSYIGVQFDLENDKVKVLCHPIKTSKGSYSNIKTDKGRFEKALASTKKQLTLGYVFKKALKSKLVEYPESADLVISRKSVEELGLGAATRLIHPGRDMEKIIEMLF